MIWNMYVLQEDLKDLDLQGHLEDDSLYIGCSLPMLVTDWPDRPDTKYLYVTMASHLPDVLPECSPRLSVLCIGKPAQVWMEASCNLLYTEKESSPELLMNRALLCYQRYRDWEEAMQHVLDQHLPLLDLAEVTQPLIANPIYAQGASFRVIFQSFPRLSSPLPLLEQYRSSFETASGSTLSPEDINDLISDPEYNRAIEAVEPTIYLGIPYGFRTLFYNVRNQNSTLARVCFDEIVAPLTKRDYVLIKVLGQYLAKGLSDNLPLAFNRPKDLDQILSGLLEHRLLPEKKILSVLNDYRWEMNDDYICMILRLKTREDTSTALAPLALTLSQMLMNDCYTVFGQSLVFVCNLTRMKRKREELLSSIKSTLRDNLLTASVSTIFRDFKDLYYYYKQAELTRILGEEKDPTKWYFLFEEYQMDYLLHRCTAKSIPQVMIPEGLLALLRHDKEKGSSYAPLLRTYLDNERNITETTRLCFIHRNTFHYRIQKIQEILQMDLDSADNRLILQIAFRLLERH
jgi:hypothetical protein